MYERTPTVPERATRVGFTTYRGSGDPGTKATARLSITENVATYRLLAFLSTRPQEGRLSRDTTCRRAGISPDSLDAAIRNLGNLGWVDYDFEGKDLP